MRELSKLVRLLVGFVLAPLLAAELSAGPPVPPVQLSVEFTAIPKSQILGAVSDSTTDRLGRIGFLATLTRVYRYQDGVLEVIASASEPGTLFQLAPGGTFYAELKPKRSTRFFSADLLSVIDSKRTILPVENAAAPVNLGFVGKLIVTVWATKDPEGIDGPFEYTFLSQQGVTHQRFERATRTKEVVDPSGTAIALLARSKVSAHNAVGEEIWSLDGRYRDAAIGGNGQIALLVPSPGEAPSRIDLRRSSGLREIQLDSPVRCARLRPDGSLGVVIESDGTVSLIDSVTGEVEEGPKLPLPAYSFVTDLELLDSDTFAVTVIQFASAKRDRVTGGRLIVVTHDAVVLANRELRQQFPVASYPAIDAVFGSGAFFAYTPDSVLFAELRD